MECCFSSELWGRTAISSCFGVKVYECWKDNIKDRLILSVCYLGSIVTWETACLQSWYTVSSFKITPAHFRNQIRHFLFYKKIIKTLWSRLRLACAKPAACSSMFVILRNIFSYSWCLDCFNFTVLLSFQKFY